ncbi:uncharacterized protein LOC133904065 isoform X2 [Phragmites australis]|uniref:uncharacterized protein LOC133904065 isoform X2 n=1 Tax=Phragmites australis TaxID=29695 RepID=UPI002D793535|nr:uncharacterized protein LOC133904065 isoform X2 [Phragmites australis]
MAERRRKRAAEEGEMRKRRKRAAEEGEMRKRRRRREGEGRSDPVELLGEEVMGRVMELLDARSAARCTAVSRAWRGVADDDRIWAPKCAELMAGKAHIPRLTLIRTASKLSTYSMAMMDGKRSRITKEDLCDHSWEYHFTIAAPEYWRNLDPAWKHTGPPMRREHYVRINRWPPMKVSRKDDWSWELSNHLYCYNSVPDAGKRGCTGPLFPVW